MEEKKKVEIHRECRWCGRYFSPQRGNQYYCCSDHQIKAGNYRKQYGDDKILAPRKIPDSLRIISAIARKAREEGLSYGQYVAKYKI